MSDGLAAFRRQLIWDRLIAIVEEQAQTLVRTAFSASTREAGDLSAGVFDTRGRMLAQAVTGTPGHVNTMAAAVGHFLKEFPAETMRPGDVYLTNDPWMGSGHLNDFTVVSPAHLGEKTVALFAATVHVVDIGGLNSGITAKDVHEEGFYVPIMPLAREGELDATFLKLLRRNVREPIQVEGDLYSLIACNRAGGNRLVELMEEFGLGDLDAVGQHIIDESRAAMLRAIAEAPHDTWRSELVIDGVEEPITLRVAVTIGPQGILVDYAGTDGISRWGINVPKTYCDAYTSYGVRCVVGPEVPNNAGSLSTIRVEAPENSILNPIYPAPVLARHMIGQLLPDTVFSALSQALPDRVPAESASSLWNIRLAHAHSTQQRYTITTFNAGGMGARPRMDGLHATAFPAGVRNVPLEITESMAPLVFWQKALRDGSGGHGEFRGGDGQVIEIGHRHNEAFVLNAIFERAVNAPRGRRGGGNGITGRVRLASGKSLEPKGRQVIAPGEHLVVEMPGGAGVGDPRRRDPALVAEDLAAGRIDADAARNVYGFEGGAPK